MYKYIELMLLGFISLLLTVGQGPISNICISKAIGNTWHPCNKKQETELLHHKDEHKNSDHENGGHRRLLLVSDPGDSARRVLSGGGADKCAAKV